MKGIPKGEIVWTSCYDENHKLMYLITSKSSRDVYYFYKYKDDVFTKLGKSSNPLDLERRYKGL